MEFCFSCQFAILHCQAMLTNCIILSIVFSNSCHVVLNYTAILQHYSVCGMQAGCERQYSAFLYGPTPCVLEVLVYRSEKKCHTQKRPRFTFSYECGWLHLSAEKDRGGENILPFPTLLLVEAVIL